MDSKVQGRRYREVSEKHFSWDVLERKGREPNHVFPCPTHGLKEVDFIFYKRKLHYFEVSACVTVPIGLSSLGLSTPGLLGCSQHPPGGRAREWPTGPAAPQPT